MNPGGPPTSSSSQPPLLHNANVPSAPTVGSQANNHPSQNPIFASLFTIRPDPEMTAMPNEIVHMIYSHLSSPRNVSNFRLSSRRFARIGAEHHFRVIHFFLEPRSVGRLIDIARNRKPEAHWFGGVNLAKLVRCVVMEEAVLRPFEDFQNMGLDESYHTGRKLYTAYREAQIDYIWGATGGQGLSVLLWNALILLPNLEGLGGHLQAGLVSQREPRPGENCDLSKILKLHIGDTQATYERRLFDARWTNKIFVVPDPGETYSSKFHSMAAKYVQGPSAQNPRSMSFNTLCVRTKRLEGALSSANGIPHYPVNPTKRVVLYYDERNMDGKDSFDLDCKILYTSFIHMTRLSLHGCSIGGGGILNLNPLDNESRPDWNNLDSLDLSNVLITKTFAFWLKQRDIRVRLYNTVWSEAALATFRTGSSFINVEVTGLQVVDLSAITCAIDAGEESEVETDEDSDRDNPHDIYIMGTEATAPLIAATYWPRMSSKPLPNQNWKFKHIIPSNMARYLKDGGDNPLTEDRCWGPTDLRMWEY